MNIVIQLIGVLGIMAAVAAFQCKRQKILLVYRTLNEFLFAIQYFLLGAYTGMAMNLVGCVRNIIFSEQMSKGKRTLSATLVFSTLFVIAGLCAWQGAKSLLIIVAKVISTFAYGSTDTSLTRKLILITSSSWLIYDLCVFSLAGVFCEAFTLVSICVGIVRLDILPKIRKNNNGAQ